MFEFSVLETIVLIVLLAASIGGFCWRFGKVLARIRAAKPDPDFSLHPLAKRIGDFVWEVMFQAKVIRERPLAGVAHAFVFWGFCAFALVTLNDIAIGFGVPFLRPGSTFAAIYFALAAVFGAFVAIAIAALFIRRFFVRPRWLGEKLSYESGVIAFLIFALMATYLAAFWIADSKLLWWAHTLALVAFLPLIPHTKHLHLVLSPFSVFLSRGSFAHIPPLV